METTQLSFVIPVYNAMKYIKELVDSLEDQSCKNFKTFFVDDASTDGTADWLENYLKNVSFQYRVVRLPQNGGPGTARNHGMTLVDTELFAFVDADDTISSNYVQALLDCCAKTEADIVVSAFKKINTNGEQKGQISKQKISSEILQSPGDCACIFDCGPCAKVMRTALWDVSSTFFPEKIRCEDLATIPVLYCKAKKIAIEEKAVYFYRQVEGSRSNNTGKHYEDIFSACSFLSERISNHDVLEYEYAYHVGYGLIMNAIMFNQPNAILNKYVDYLRINFPCGHRNHNLCYLHRFKRMFVRLAYMKLFSLLRIMVCVYGMMRS
jgi:glycosyltransferase involved in cell wall biosynthesis